MNARTARALFDAVEDARSPADFEGCRRRLRLMSREQLRESLFFLVTACAADADNVPGISDNLALARAAIELHGDAWVHYFQPEEIH